MKAYTRVLSAALGMAALPIFLACDDPQGTQLPDIAVQPRVVTLRVGQTLRFEAYAYAEEAKGRDMAWQSTEPEVAELLDDNGLVVALSPGTTVISASCDEYRGTAVVTVTEPRGGEPEDKRRGVW